MNLKRDPQAGFTLFELMIAIAIISFMMVVAWSTTNQTIRAKIKYEELQEQQRKVRVALTRIVRDLSMAYVSGNENRDLTEPRTMFEGQRGGDTDELMFSTFAHTPLFANANQSDQTIIRYYTATDPEDSSKENLMRWEAKRLPYGEETPSTVSGEANVLFPGVTKFKLEYYDNRDKEWKDAWSTKPGEGGTAAPRPPDRVRLVLGYERNDEELTFTTQVRVHMQEMVNGFAN